jgi:DNA-directed RNA polymerase subunit K/omega
MNKDIPNVDTNDINIPKDDQVNEATNIKNDVKKLVEGEEIENKNTDEEENNDIEDFTEDNKGGITSDEDDDEDDEDEDEDLDLKKFDQELNNNILNSYHPSTKHISYEEVLALCKITKNKKGIIMDPFHTTIPILTRYEFAKVIGLRAKQLNHGSTPFIDNLDPNIIDGHTIALKEFHLKKIPFIIKRPLPNGVNEYWNIRDLEYIE